MIDYIGYIASDEVEADIRPLEALQTKAKNVNEHNQSQLFMLQKETQQYFSNDALSVLFTGTCYNLLQLQTKAAVKSNDIAEIIAHLFVDEGITLLEGIRGNFSVIINDYTTEIIYGARDHFGVKPIFYIDAEEKFVFSSTKKGVSLFLEEEVVDKVSLQHYFSFQFVPNPLSLTKGIKLLPAGSYFKKKIGQPLEIIRYFQQTFAPRIAEKDDWIKRVRDTMIESVTTHMGDEESIGSFLSGGIDSTFVASIAKEVKPNIKTFSVGFARDGFSEIDVAKETADKLGLENISRVITPEEYIEKLPEIIWHLDDPLADPSCVPLYFVANEAKKHVDKTLSGEGADELFGGYNIYREPDSLKSFNYVPGFMKSAIGQIAKALPRNMKGKSFLERGTTPLQERYIGNAKIFEEIDKQKILRHYDDREIYQKITRPYFDEVKNEPLVTQMQYVDMQTWLQGDILLKARKMSAANNLEVRMPFLDIEVFKVAREIPVDLMIANGTTKQILREAARGIIPDHVLNRKKLGFPVPMRHWLKEELNTWALTLIDESETDEYINKQFVRELYTAHCNGQADYSRKIWTVLIFMLWHQIFVENKYDFGK